MLLNLMQKLVDGAITHFVFAFYSFIFLKYYACLKWKKFKIQNIQKVNSCLYWYEIVYVRLHEETC